MRGGVEVKKCNNNARLSCEKLANPYEGDYYERLVKSGAIDLVDNHEVIDLGNGYSEIVPIDESKKVK